MKIKKYRNFFWIGIFDNELCRYGGHSQWLSKLTGLDYLCFLIKQKEPHKTCSFYYDGWHHYLNLKIFSISWGGKPNKVLFKR